MFAFLMGLRSASTADVLCWVQSDSARVIDVNSPRSWNKAHVPSALNLDSTGFSDKELPDDKRSRLVFYCSNPMCRKAPNAARRAKKMGYEDVWVMSAGISGWQSAGLPTESGGGP
jgi:rhodanese-related sulfurtransferase